MFYKMEKNMFKNFFTIFVISFTIFSKLPISFAINNPPFVISLPAGFDGVDDVDDDGAAEDLNSNEIISMQDAQYEPYAEREPLIAYSSACGGVLDGLSGKISYKSGQPFKNNEKCTWTIYAEKAATINFTLMSNGLIQSTEDYIKIGFFLDSDFKTLENFNEVVLSHNALNRTVSVPGPVAFLRFFSDYQINGLGFEVTYTSKASNVSLPFKFSNYFYDGPSGIIHYPKDGRLTYGPLERVSITLQPKLNGFLALKYFQGNCGIEKDFLTLYTRGGGGSYYGTLATLQQFCNSTVTTVPYWSLTALNEYLITFHTSISAHGQGFELIWTSEPS